MKTTALKRNRKISTPLKALSWMTSWALLFFPLMGQAADLPTGAAVVSGNVDVSTAGDTMTVNQGTNRAIVNWDTFDIGTGFTVNVNQPDRQAAMLSRVVGGDPSHIMGNLNATGIFYLVNQSGVYFGQSAQVNVPELIVSTLNIRDNDFLAGTITFSGDSTADIVNEGKLSGEKVALLAGGGRVTNTGQITAPHVALAAGETVDIGTIGGGSLSIDIQGLTGEVVNEGGIDASGTPWSPDGGTVLAKADGVANFGEINADGIGAGDGGDVTLAGNTLISDGDITARGGTDGGDGGFVETSGYEAFIINTAPDVSGGEDGDAGLWLIDPYNIEITTLNPEGNIVEDSLLNGEIFPDGSPAYLDPATIATALSGGTNVTIMTTPVVNPDPGGLVELGNITVTSAINTAGDPGAIGVLTLDADNDIIINNSITLNGGLVIDAVNTISVSGVTTQIITVGDIQFVAVPTQLAGTIESTSGSVNIAGPVTLVTDTTVRAGVDMTFGSTVDGTHGLGITAAGNVALVGALGGTTPLDYVNISAGGTLAMSDVRTDRFQNYWGDAILNSAYTTNGWDIVFNDNIQMNSATTLDTGIGAGNITVVGTIDGAYALNVTAGTGSVDFRDIVGGAAPLVSVNVSGQFLSMDGVTTTGSQLYDVDSMATIGGTYTSSGADIDFIGPVTLGSDTTVTTLAPIGGSIYFDSADGPYNLILNANGGIDLGTAGGTTPLASIDATGNWILGTSVETTGATNLHTTGAGQIVSITGPIDADFFSIDGQADITLDTVTSAGAVSIQGLDLDATSLTTLGTVTILPTSSVNLGADNGGAMVLSGTELDGITTPSLTIGDGTNGIVTFEGLIAGDTDAIGDLTVYGAGGPPGIRFIDAASVFGNTGELVFEAAAAGVFIGQNVTLGGGNFTIYASGGDVDIAGTLTGGNNFIIDPPANINITAAVNMAGDIDWKASSHITTASGANVTAGGTVSMVGGGDVYINSNIAANGGAMLLQAGTGGSGSNGISFGNSGNVALTAAGDMTLRGANVDLAPQGANTISVNTNGNDLIFDLTGTVPTSTDLLTVNGAVTLNIRDFDMSQGSAARTLAVDTLASPGHVDPTILAAAGVTGDIILRADGALSIVNTSALTFGGLFDAESLNDTVTVMQSLTANGGISLTGNAASGSQVILQAGPTLTTTGTAIDINGRLGLSVAGASLVSNGGNITVTDTIGLLGGQQALTINAGTGDVNLQGTVNNIASLTVNSAANIDTVAVTTVGNANFVATSSIDIAGPANVQSLNANAGSGTVSIQDVTTTAGGVALAGTAGITLDNSTITVIGGGATMNGPVTLANGPVSVDTTSAGGNITFYSTIGGPQTLALAAGTGNVDLQGAVSNIAGLNVVSASQVDLANIVSTGPISVTGTNIDLNGTTYQTTGQNINFAGAADLTAGPVAVTTGAGVGNIAFSSTIDGAQILTLTAGTGGITLAGAIGATTPLSSLTASGATISVHDVTTVAGQSYTAPGGITLNSTYTASGGLMQFVGPTILNSDTDINQNGTGDGDDVLFNGAVTVSGGNWDLDINVADGLGDVTFTSTVGTTGNRLDDFTVDGNLVTIGGAVYADDMVFHGNGAADTLQLNGLLNATNSITVGANNTTDRVETVNINGVDIIAGTGVLFDGVAGGGTDVAVNVTAGPVIINGGTGVIGGPEAALNVGAFTVNLRSDGGVTLGAITGTGTLGLAPFTPGTEILIESASEAPGYIIPATTLQGIANTFTQVNIGDANAGPVYVALDDAVDLSGRAWTNGLTLTGSSAQFGPNAFSIGTGLAVTATNGSITDSGTLAVTGLANFTANGGGNITLGDGTTANFGTLTFRGNNVSIVEASQMDLAGVNFALDTLALTANGINQTPGVLAVGGTTTLDANGFDISLEQPGNNFIGAVSIFDTANAALVDSVNRLVLDDVTVANVLHLTTTDGPITQTATGVTAPNLVFEVFDLHHTGSGLDFSVSTANDFGTVAGATLGGDVAIIDVNAMAVGTVGAVSGISTVAATGGSITLETGGMLTIDQPLSTAGGTGGALNVGGAVINAILTLGAGDINLNNGVATAGDIIINNDLLLGAGDANFVTSSGGVWVTGTGSVTTTGDVVMTGDAWANTYGISPAYPAGVAIDGFLTVNNLDITSTDLLSAGGTDVTVNAPLTATGSIDVTSANDVIVLNDMQADVAIDITASNTVFVLPGVTIEADTDGNTVGDLTVTADDDTDGTGMLQQAVSGSMLGANVDLYGDIVLLDGLVQSTSGDMEIDASQVIVQGPGPGARIVSAGLTDIGVNTLPPPAIVQLSGLGITSAGTTTIRSNGPVVMDSIDPNAVVETTGVGSDIDILAAGPVFLTNTMRLDSADDLLISGATVDLISSNATPEVWSGGDTDIDATVGLVSIGGAGIPTDLVVGGNLTIDATGAQVFQNDGSMDVTGTVQIGLAGFTSDFFQGADAGDDNIADAILGSSVQIQVLTSIVLLSNSSDDAIEAYAGDVDLDALNGPIFHVGSGDIQASNNVLINALGGFSQLDPAGLIQAGDTVQIGVLGNGVATASADIYGQGITATNDVTILTTGTTTVANAAIIQSLTADVDIDADSIILTNTASIQAAQDILLDAATLIDIDTLSQGAFLTAGDNVLIGQTTPGATVNISGNVTAGDAIIIDAAPLTGVVQVDEDAVLTAVTGEIDIAAGATVSLADTASMSAGDFLIIQSGTIHLASNNGATEVEAGSWAQLWAAGGNITFANDTDLLAGDFVHAETAGDILMTADSGSSITSQTAGVSLLATNVTTDELVAQTFIDIAATGNVLVTGGTTVNDGYIYLRGDYEADGTGDVTVNGAGTVMQAQGLGADSEGIIWLAGQNVTIDDGALVWAQGRDDDGDGVPSREFALAVLAQNDITYNGELRATAGSIYLFSDAPIADLTGSRHAGLTQVINLPYDTVNEGLIEIAAPGTPSDGTGSILVGSLGKLSALGLQSDIVLNAPGALTINNITEAGRNVLVYTADGITVEDGSAVGAHHGHIIMHADAAGDADSLVDWTAIAGGADGTGDFFMADNSSMIANLHAPSEGYVYIYGANATLDNIQANGEDAAGAGIRVTVNSQGTGDTFIFGRDDLQSESPNADIIFDLTAGGGVATIEQGAGAHWYSNGRIVFDTDPSDLETVILAGDVTTNEAVDITVNGPVSSIDLTNIGTLTIGGDFTLSALAGNITQTSGAVLTNAGNIDYRASDIQLTGGTTEANSGYIFMQAASPNPGTGNIIANALTADTNMDDLMSGSTNIAIKLDATGSVLLGGAVTTDSDAPFNQRGLYVDPVNVIFAAPVNVTGNIIAWATNDIDVYAPLTTTGTGSQIWLRADDDGANAGTLGAPSGADGIGSLTIYPGASLSTISGDIDLSGESVTFGNIHTFGDVNVTMDLDNTGGVQSILFAEIFANDLNLALNSGTMWVIADPHKLPAGDINVTGTPNAVLSLAADFTANGNINVGVPTLLSGDSRVSGGLGMNTGAVTFSAPINSAVAGQNTLFIDNSTGAVSVGAIGATTALDSLVIDGLSVAIGGPFQTQNNIRVTTHGDNNIAHQGMTSLGGGIYLNSDGSISGQGILSAVNGIVSLEADTGILALTDAKFLEADAGTGAIDITEADDVIITGKGLVSDFNGGTAVKLQSLAGSITGGDITALGGSTGHVDLDAAGHIEGVHVVTLGDASLDTGLDIIGVSVTADGIINIGQTAPVRNLMNSTLAAGSAANVTVSDDVHTSDITAISNITVIAGDSIIDTDMFSSNGAISATATAGNIAAGSAVSEGSSVTATANSGVIDGLVVEAATSATLNALQIVNGSVTTLGGDADLNATGNIAGQTVAALGNVTLDADGDISDTSASATGDIIVGDALGTDNLINSSLAADQLIRVTVGDDVNNTAMTANDGITITAGQSITGTDMFTTNGAISATATAGNIAAGSAVSEGSSVTATANSGVIDGLVVEAATGATLNALQIVNGSVTTLGGVADLNATGNISGQTVSALGDVTLDADQYVTDTGVSATGTVVIGGDPLNGTNNLLNSDIAGDAGVTVTVSDDVHGTQIASINDIGVTAGGSIVNTGMVTTSGAVTAEATTGEIDATDIVASGLIAATAGAGISASSFTTETGDLDIDVLAGNIVGSVFNAKAGQAWINWDQLGGVATAGLVEFDGSTVTTAGSIDLAAEWINGSTFVTEDPGAYIGVTATAGNIVAGSATSKQSYVTATAADGAIDGLVVEAATGATLNALQ
ncbi:MAG: filamentous hemagglutinin N-terminal domain-containing protein, partial [Lentisphaeria bacterium]|nr:filamentous hemagglutinin N-terminal domain-containing protein [Lentisphaeria bacterium]